MDGLTTESQLLENMAVLDREDGWFGGGVKEAIYVKQEEPSLNRVGGLRHQLSAAYDAVC